MKRRMKAARAVANKLRQAEKRNAAARGGRQAKSSVAQLLAPATLAISKAVRLAESTARGENRGTAEHLIRTLFWKNCRAMRALVRRGGGKDAKGNEASEALRELVQQTVYNCALFYNAEAVDRKTLSQIATGMDEFPVLQSASSRLRDITRRHLDAIQLAQNLPTPRGSTRLTSNRFTSVARDILKQLHWLLLFLSSVPKVGQDTNLDAPNLFFRTDHPKSNSDLASYVNGRVSNPDPAIQNAVELFGRPNFQLSNLDSKEWPAVWNIIRTLIVTDDEVNTLTGPRLEMAFCSLARPLRR
jgi:hypothetical protein